MAMVKRKKIDVTSSSSAYEKGRFVSREAELRFNTCLKNKDFVAERGFDIQRHRETIIGHQIEARQWESLLETPSSAVAPVVREFYANGKEHKNKKVFVRGKFVSFVSTSINKVYGLSDVDDSRYQHFCEDPNYDQVIACLTSGSTRWTLSRKDKKTVISFPVRNLTHQNKMWHYFIIARLKPSLNTTNVTKDRAILNYAINMGWPIDVGKVIEHAILDYIMGNNNGGLPYPLLVYDLCKEKGALGTDKEEIVHPRSIIDSKRFRRTGGNNSSESEPETLPSSSTSVPDSTTMLLLQIQQSMTQNHGELLARLDAMKTRVDAMEAKVDTIYARFPPPTPDGN